MDAELKREIIMDHYQNPRHHGLIDDDNYIRINSNSESCIDNIDIQYKIEDGIIKDAYFDGEACAISSSATSIMLDLVIGKTVDDAKEIIRNYRNMINEEEYDESILEELNAYNTIYLQPNRKKCAMLPFDSLEKAIDRK